MPPSPLLSARRTIPTYFTETRRMRLQRMSETKPKMSARVAPSRRHSLNAYRGAGSNVTENNTQRDEGQRQ
jgi:hypothetical protein